MAKKIEDYELWNPIKGFEGIYEVSSRGAVVRLLERWRNGHQKECRKEMAVNKVGSGYYGLRLVKNGVAVRVLLHRVVADAFIPNLYNLPQVNHKDGDKGNNAVPNLEWCSAKHNIQHAVRTGLTPPNINHAAISKPVIQKRADGSIVCEYPSMMEAVRQTGFSHPNISLAVKNKIKRYGYYWESKNAI